MFLHSVLSSREGVLVDLGLDLLPCVRHEDARVRVARAHLPAVPLERREEDALYQGGLMVPKLWDDVPGHAKVGVLVNGARDEAPDLLVIAEDVREGIRQSGGSLHRRECDLADVVLALEPKDAPRLCEVCPEKKEERGEGSVVSREFW